MTLSLRIRYSALAAASKGFQCVGIDIVSLYYVMHMHNSFGIFDCCTVACKM